uniref:Uncharacterized protein n=1 Tax=Leptospira santarosai serovar Arenal str. MAVJ 401 TaxID=1049976 RepID=M6JQ73_9LEPT|nr:hypothetical protein LEP1GSC063_3664 [Leptospira santarosai serovar Arenal str. MAVJ 401]
MLGFGIFDEFWEGYCVSLSPAFEFKMWELPHFVSPETYY